MSSKKSGIKFYKNTILLVGVVLVLVAAYVWILPLVTRNNDGTPGKSQNPEAVQLVKVNQNSIKQMSISNKLQNIELEYQPAKGVNSDGTEYDTYQWVMVSPTGYDDIDQLLVRSITSNFADIVSTKIIEEDPADLSKYGLNDPKIITVKMENGEEIVVKVGDKAPLTTACYVLVGDDPTVYTIKSYTAGKITPLVNELRSTSIFDFTATSVKSIAMGRDGNKLFKADRTEKDIWVLEYPIPADSNTETVGKLIESLIALYKQVFVEENPTDLSKYNLDKPFYEFELQSVDGKSKRVYLGKEDKSDGTFYARFDDSDEVFKVPAMGLTYIDKPLTEIMQLFCYIVNYKFVDKLVVNVKDQPEQVSIIQASPESTSKDVFYFNGRDATMKDIDGHQAWRIYYQSIIGVLLKEIDIEATPVGEPEVTFTYHLNDGTGTVVVEFIPRGDNQTYYCNINGEYTGMVVDRRSFYGKNGVMERYDYLMRHIEGE